MTEKSGSGEGGSCLICLVILRWSGFVVYVVAWVNWWLKAVAMAEGLESCLLLKVMVLFGVWSCFLPEREEMVFQSVLVFFLWSQSLLMWSCQSWERWVRIRIVIDLLSSGREGSFGLVFRFWFLSSIFCLMFCGRGMWWVWSFPLGMKCLSASSMAFVRMWFAE